MSPAKTTKTFLVNVVAYINAYVSNDTQEAYMKKKLLSFAVMATCLAMGSSAFGQGNPQRNDGGRNAQFQHNGPGDGRGDRPGAGRGGPPSRPAAPPPRFDHHNDRGRGAGPSHNYYRGGRLPPEYRNRQYVIDNWRVHHLSPPPRGQYWVQLGADYALVAIATGIITQIVLNGR